MRRVLTMWPVLRNRRVLQVTAVVIVLLAVALWPRSTMVDVGRVSRGPMVVTIDEEGETRVHHRFVVSAPLAGRIDRIELEPGDVVRRGDTVVTRIHPEAPQLLDARSRAEAEAGEVSARAAVGGARADEQRARAARDLAATELQRADDLFSSGLITRQALDARKTDLATAEESLRAAEFAAATAASDLQRARVRLRPSSLEAAGAPLAIVAPVDGVVLRRYRESAGVVPAGEPLVEIGDPSHVEIVADLLSSDAVKVARGMAVSVEQWGGDRPMAATVTRVEPAGFTKVSALGVEEQRVNVIMDVDDDEAAWAALGDAFRVEVRIAVWKADDVVRVPTSALFRTGDQWAVYVVEGGRARRVPIAIGQRTSSEAEVLEGLQDGQAVVLHPPDTVADGTRVAARE
ncbi:MAG: efflux RND transporter periplasmic adaptor subunit [Vicinamibacterales bacterium]